MKKTLILTFFMLLMPFSAQSIEYKWENETGKEMALSALKGKPVILHFWASWCPPCRTEMPDLVKWIEHNPETTVIIVSLDSDKEDAMAFFAEKGIKLPLNMGRMRDTSSLGVRGLPSTFIIGEDSEIKKRYVGDIDWADEVASKEVLHWL